MYPPKVQKFEHNIIEQSKLVIRLWAWPVSCWSKILYFSDETRSKSGIETSTNRLKNHIVTITSLGKHDLAGIMHYVLNHRMERLLFPPF